DDYNPSEDAEDMGGNGALLSLSAFSRDKLTKISIDGVPGFDKVRSIPLYADATTSGLYEFNRLELVGAPDVYQVWLKDHFTKDSLDLRSNKTYSFRIDKSNAATFGDNRFELVFRRRPLAPYELLSLTAEKTGDGGVTLKWRTLNEYIYTGFTVERSDAAGNFVPLTEMQSDGKGSYTLYDPAKVSGSVSYRILQDKPDGSKAYSPVVKVTESIRRPFFISPNPASDYLNVQLDHETEARLRVVDTRGRLIMGTSFSGTGTRLNISSLKAGVYIIEVTDNISFKILGKEKWVKL
ncbi:MAG: T9SS type A sorting domain-containing protein, partial [Mucilaginibacter polytrichastri]|nr:T9SS type A sorting domain-containing protein [Mucilaginibacter polytrichastri]